MKSAFHFLSGRLRGWLSTNPQMDLSFSLSPFWKREADIWGMMWPKSPWPSSPWISHSLANDLFGENKARVSSNQARNVVSAATRKSTDKNQGEWEALVWRQPSGEELSTPENLGSGPETLSKLDNPHPGSPSPYMRLGESKGPGLTQWRQSQDAPLLLVWPRWSLQETGSTSGKPSESSQGGPDQPAPGSLEGKDYLRTLIGN